MVRVQAHVCILLHLWRNGPTAVPGDYVSHHYVVGLDGLSFPAHRVQMRRKGVFKGDGAVKLREMTTSSEISRRLNKTCIRKSE